MKNLKLTIKSYTLAFALLGLALITLMGGPQLINLTQDNLAFYIHSLATPDNQQQVAGVSASPKIEIKDQGLTPPSLTAHSALVLDLDSNELLFQKDIHAHLLPASTTKLMTALVAVDHYQSGDYLLVPSEALVGGSTMGLQTGESLSFHSLLYGMLLNSGNDAAYTLALDYPGGMASFITEMNNRVATFGLKDTHFDNPAGFDSPNHYSSAYDLSQIAKLAIANPQLAKIVATKETSVESPGGYPEHILKNVDTLLQNKGFIGIKTGYTDNAGQNFVGLVNRDNHELITVVLDSQDRFGETEKLADWAYTNFTWQDSQN